MQYQAVVFDMDGVIFDTERLVIEFWKEVAKKHNIPNVEHTCIQCLGTNRVRTREIFLENYGADFPFDPYRAEVTELFNTHYKGVPLPTKPGVRELLSYLQEQSVLPPPRPSIWCVMRSALPDFFPIFRHWSAEIWWNTVNQLLIFF